MPISPAAHYISCLLHQLPITTTSTLPQFQFQIFLFFQHPIRYPLLPNQICLIHIDIQLSTNQKKCPTASEAFYVIFTLGYFQLIYPSSNILVSTNSSEKSAMHHVSMKSGGGLTPHYCSPLSASRPWADPRLHHFMIQFLHWRLYSDDNYSPGAGGVWSRSTARYITTGEPQLSCPLLILTVSLSAVLRT